MAQLFSNQSPMAAMLALLTQVSASSKDRPLGKDINLGEILASNGIFSGDTVTASGVEKVDKRLTASPVSD